MICSDYQGSRKVTKIKCVFRKLLCSSCMYKRSDQEKMQWSPTWWLSTKSHLVFFFNGKTAISIGRKKPRVAQVVIAKSAGLPDYHAHKKYLILPRQIPHKVNPISQNPTSHCFRISKKCGLTIYYFIVEELNLESKIQPKMYVIFILQVNSFS